MRLSIGPKSSLLVTKCQILSAVAGHGVMPANVGRLLAAFASAGDEGQQGAPQPLIEPLCQRELEVLRLVARGLSNPEIGERLFLGLNSVNGHNQNIFGQIASSTAHRGSICGINFNSNIIATTANGIAAKNTKQPASAVLLGLTRSFQSILPSCKINSQAF